LLLSAVKLRVLNSHCREIQFLVCVGRHEELRLGSVAYLPYPLAIPCDFIPVSEMKFSFAS
jgi:hypothetical protein